RGCSPPGRPWSAPATRRSCAGCSAWSSPGRSSPTPRPPGRLRHERPQAPHADEHRPATAGRWALSAQTFVYRAVDRSGGSLVGELTGEGKAAVAAVLRLRGLTVVDIDAKRGAPSVGELLDRMRGVKPREITVMARQLATMIASGLSLLRALYVLED